MAVLTLGVLSETFGVLTLTPGADRLMLGSVTFVLGTVTSTPGTGRLTSGSERLTFGSCSGNPSSVPASSSILRAGCLDLVCTSVSGCQGRECIAARAMQRDQAVDSGDLEDASHAVVFTAADDRQRTLAELVQAHHCPHEHADRG